MKSYLNQKSAPRGIRNNNPGNLIKTAIQWQGKIPHEQNNDSRFEQFTSIIYGLRAMAKDITNDIKKGKNTLKLLITEYAPPYVKNKTGQIVKENDTAAYIAAVSKSVGIPPDAKIKITPEILQALITAKVQVENGAKWKKYISAEDIQQAVNLALNKNAETIKTAAKITPAILLIIGAGYLILTR